MQPRDVPPRECDRPSCEGGALPVCPLATPFAELDRPKPARRVVRRLALRFVPVPDAI